MVKNRDEVRRDVLDMCGWVQDSYQFPENFFLEQFHKLLGYISKMVNTFSILYEYTNSNRLFSLALVYFDNSQ